jgi:hypothetical protein
MERVSQVLEVEVEHDGTAYRASYFVENATIHASVCGRMLIAPLGPEDAAQTVKTLLSGYLLHQDRKLKHAQGWRSAARA